MRRWEAVNDEEPEEEENSLSAEDESSEDDAGDARVDETPESKAEPSKDLGDSKEDGQDDGQEAGVRRSKREKKAKVVGFDNKVARAKVKPKVRKKKRKRAENVELIETKAARRYEEAMHELGNNDVNSEKWNEVRAVLQELVDLDSLKNEQLKLGPKIRYHSICNLAYMDEKSGNLQDALKKLLEASSLTTDDFFLWLRIGRLSKTCGNIALSRFAFEHVLRGQEKSKSLWPALQEAMSSNFAMGDDIHCKYLSNRALELDSTCVNAMVYQVAMDRTDIPGTIKSALPKIALDDVSRGYKARAMRVIQSEALPASKSLVKLQEYSLVHLLVSILEVYCSNLDSDCTHSIYFEDQDVKAVQGQEICPREDDNKNEDVCEPQLPTTPVTAVTINGQATEQGEIKVGKAQGVCEKSGVTAAPEPILETSKKKKKAAAAKPPRRMSKRGLADPEAGDSTKRMRRNGNQDENTLRLLTTALFGHIINTVEETADEEKKDKTTKTWEEATKEGFHSLLASYSKSIIITPVNKTEDVITVTRKPSKVTSSVFTDQEREQVRLLLGELLGKTALDALVCILQRMHCVAAPYNVQALGQVLLHAHQVLSTTNSSKVMCLIHGDQVDLEAWECVLYQGELLLEYSSASNIDVRTRKECVEILVGFTDRIQSALNNTWTFTGNAFLQLEARTYWFLANVAGFLGNEHVSLKFLSSCMQCFRRGATETQLKHVQSKSRISKASLQQKMDKLATKRVLIEAKDVFKNSRDSPDQLASVFTILIDHYMPNGVLSHFNELLEEQSWFIRKGGDKTTSILHMLWESAGASERIPEFCTLLVKLLAHVLSSGVVSETGITSEVKLAILLNVLSHLQLAVGNKWEGDQETDWAWIFSSCCSLLNAVPDMDIYLSLLSSLARVVDLDILHQNLISILCMDTECIVKLADKELRATASSQAGLRAAKVLGVLHTLEGTHQATKHRDIYKACLSFLCERSFSWVFSMKKQYQWIKELVLLSLTALIDVLGSSDNISELVRVIPLSQVALEVLKLKGFKQQDTFRYNLLHTCAETISKGVLSRAVHSLDYPGYGDLEDSRQNTLSDALYILYGVVEFAGDDNDYNAKPLFPESHRREFWKNSTGLSVVPESLRQSFLEKEKPNPESLECGALACISWEPHRTILCRFILNHLSARFLKRVTYEGKGSKPIMKHMERLVHYLLVRSLESVSSASTKLGEINTKLCSFSFDENHTATILKPGEKSSSNPAGYDPELVDLTELCQRLPLYYGDLLEQNLPKRLLISNGKKQSVELAEMTRLLQKHRDCYTICVAFDALNFRAWYSLGETIRRKQSLLLSRSEVCAAAVDVYAYFDNVSKRGSELTFPPQVQEGIKLLRESNGRAFDEVYFCWANALSILNEEVQRFRELPTTKGAPFLPRRFCRVGVDFRKSGMIYNGTVTRVNSDSTVDLCYEDHDDLEFSLPNSALVVQSDNVQTLCQVENPLDTLFDCTLQLGVYLYSHLSFLKRIEPEKLEIVGKRALQLFKDAINISNLLPTKSTTTGLLAHLHYARYMYARVLEKMNPAFDDESACVEILDSYAGALETAPMSGKDSDICQPEIIYRLHSVRLKILDANESRYVELVAKDKYCFKTSGDSDMFNDKVKNAVQNCLDGLSYCARSEETDRLNSHRAVYRLAKALRRFGYLFPPPESNPEETCGKRALGHLNIFFNKDAKARLCCVLHPKFTTRYDNIVKAWFKTERVSLRCINLYLVLCEDTGDYTKARALLCLLLEKKWDKDIERVGLLRGACNAVHSMQRIISKDLENQETKKPKTVSAIMQAAAAVAGSSKHDGRWEATLPLLEKAYVLYLDCMSVLLVLRGRQKDFGLVRLGQNAKSSTCQFLERIYTFGSSSENVVTTGLGEGFKKVLRFCEEKWPEKKKPTKARANVTTPKKKPVVSTRKMSLSPPAPPPPPPPPPPENI